MKITANRSEEEPGRIARLNDVAAKLKTSTTILALHDHKGWLYVNWAARPSTYDLWSVLKVWSEENEIQSNHYVNGEPLIWDVGGDNPFGGPLT